MARVSIIAVLLAGPAIPGTNGHAVAHEPKPSAAIERGSRVSLEYTLTDDAGALLESNEGRDPLQYTHGTRQLLPALEAALQGMRIGDKKEIVLPPRDGYGELDPDAVSEVPKDQIPIDARRAGVQLVSQSPQGAMRVVRVKEVREQTVLLDLNHPLAGKTLHFHLRVIGLQPPAESR